MDQKRSPSILKALRRGSRSLNLKARALTTLPAEIGELKALNVLDVSRNQLTTLPAEIGELKELAFLDLSNNQLSVLPTEIGELKKLKFLHLQGNQLLTLPPGMGNLKELIWLDLSHNRLTQLPPGMGQLKNLDLLDLSRNRLTKLPPEMGVLRGLELIVDDCLVSPPPEIRLQGTAAMLRFLDAQADGVRQWASKLLAVGEGGVGKTELLRSLRGDSFHGQLPTTHGIEIRKLELEHPEYAGVSLRLVSWDFGGQEIYHATHQFFLTGRSLFLLVWNARVGYEACKLEYWLEAIKARAPQSPIIIVGAHVDERAADLPLEDFRRRFPRIVGHYPVSNKTREGIPELREVIQRVATGLPLMGLTWPRRWLTAAEALSERSERYSTRSQVVEIMRGYGVETEHISVLLRWLHELGQILCFLDETDLRDIVVLRPQWVTEYISKVLESDDVIMRNGILTKAHMEELWADLHPFLRDHFLRLMEQFDLSYRTLQNRELSYVVERLPLDEADYHEAWDEILTRPGCKVLSLRYHLSSLPPGIPTWFTARSHRFTTHTHWRFGALLKDGEDPRHLGLIVASPSRRTVSLSVRGPHPHNFFALLRDGLELTLRRYPGLECKRTIPCPGHGGQPCSYAFDYENLIRRIDADPPRDMIECPKALEMVSVSQLLFGIDWRTHDAVASEIEGLRCEHKLQQAQLLEELRRQRDGLAELTELVQREFARRFRRDQASEESHCPNVFILRPKQGNSWARSLFMEPMELHLFCQMPGRWHATVEGGCYTIRNPKRWLEKAGGLIGGLASILQHTLPVVGPWLGSVAPEYAQQLKADLDLMSELAARLPELKKSEWHEHVPRELGTGERAKAEGAALRALRQLLDKLDPIQHWGGLKKVYTPEGHYLWLCEYHAEEFRR